jgi:hypothetical protein
MAKAPALRERETAPLATGLSLIEETNLMESRRPCSGGGVLLEESLLKAPGEARYDGGGNFFKKSMFLRKVCFLIKVCFFNGNFVFVRHYVNSWVLKFAPART